MAQVTGTVVVRLNGSSLRSEEGATLDIGGFERTERYADHSLLGFSKKPIAAVVSCSIAHTALTDLRAIEESEDVTLIFETDTGVTYTIRNAFCTKPPSMKEEGKVDLEFKGQPAV